jgi:hypothetical protein
MFKFIRKIICLVLVLLTLGGVLIYSGLYTPAGFVSTKSLGNNTLLVGRVVQRSPSYYRLKDASGSTWIFSGDDTAPSINSFVICWCSLRMDSGDTRRPAQIFRLGTF